MYTLPPLLTKKLLLAACAAFLALGGLGWYAVHTHSANKATQTIQTAKTEDSAAKKGSSDQSTVAPAPAAANPNPAPSAANPTTSPATKAPVTTKKTSPAPAPAPAPTPVATKTYSCTTSVLPHGTCGPYPGYAKMTGIDGAPFVDQNVWAGGAGYTQAISANSPGDWKVVANANTHFGGVQSFPNTGWGMPWPERKVDTYTSVTSSWNVTLPRNPETVGWAAYDLWFNDWADEVMIQVDIQANSFYNCDAVTTATFSGQPWHMCEFGSERVWKRGTDDNHLVNQSSGSLNIQEMLVWMEQHGQLPANSTWTAGSFGFEVCDTGGMNATFTMNDFSWASQ